MNINLRLRWLSNVAVWGALFSSSAVAKPITPGNDATRETALIMLEVQLRPLLAEENPTLKVERSENSIVVSGPDFQTRISTEYDLVFVRPALSSENSKNRYNFATVQDFSRFKDEPENLPLETWPYTALEDLNKTGIIEERPGKPGGTFDRNVVRTRYDFAVVMSRLREKLPPVRNKEGLSKHHPTFEDNYEALIYEFAPEMSRLGVCFRCTSLNEIKDTIKNSYRTNNRYVGTHKYQYFQISVSDPNWSQVKLTEEIRQTVADFASEYLKLKTTHHEKDSASGFGGIGEGIRNRVPASRPARDSG